MIHESVAGYENNGTNTWNKKIDSVEILFLRYVSSLTPALPPRGRGRKRYLVITGMGNISVCR
jgi:hypothetical protein